MGAEYFGGVDSQGAVDKYGNARYIPLVDHPVQAVHNLLGAAHGKGGDDDFATPLHGAHYDLAHFIVCGFRVPVRLIAICALHDHVVSPTGQHRIAHQWQVKTANVT